jgi:hypothetical protein
MIDTTPTFSCPRCGGTGTFTLVCDDGNGVSDDCIPCRHTGRVTVEQWNDWCDFLKPLEEPVLPPSLMEALKRKSNAAG